MNKLLTIILCFISLSGFSQYVDIFKVADSNTAFGYNMPKYRVILDAESRKFWIIDSANLAAEKLSTISYYGKQLIGGYTAGSGINISRSGVVSSAVSALEGNGTAAWLKSPYIKLGIGTSNPTYSLSFDAQTMPVWGAERNLTNNTRGTGVTISAGGAKSGALNTGSDPLIFQAPATTGNSSTAIKFQSRKRSSTTSTTDNALYDQTVFLGEDKILNNTNDTIFSVEISEDSFYVGLVSYNLVVMNATTTVTKSGLYQFTAIKVSGVWSGSFSELTMTVNLFGSTLTSTPTILFKHSPRRAYMLMNYNSNLSSITKMKLGLAIENQMGGTNSTTQY